MFEWFVIKDISSFIASKNQTKHNYNILTFMYEKGV